MQFEKKARHFGPYELSNPNPNLTNFFSSFFTLAILAYI